MGFLSAFLSSRFSSFSYSEYDVDRVPRVGEDVQFFAGLGPWPEVGAGWRSL